MTSTTGTLDIEIIKNDHSKINEIDFENLAFGKNFSDHMLMADFENGKWGDFRIIPFGNFEIHPSMASLHYGQALFEGLKAYKSPEGDILLFRPLENARRMNRSAERLCMAQMPEEMFMEALTTYLDLERNWVSDKEGCSLYVRPFMFSTEAFLGVKPSDSYRFMIITSPVGNYYDGAIKVKVELEYTRAAKGGTGQAKAAGNYAAALYPAKLGQDKGYRQLVWTDAKEHKYIEESGTMNIFFMIDGKLITPSLDSGTILSGVTRDSIITVAKKWGIPVEERKISIDEVVENIKNKKLTEVFGAGTAATIAQIALMNIGEVDYTLPEVETREFSNKIAKYLSDIRTGKVEDPFGWVVRI
jgi:branched-chain amino acid aminotransferase